MTRLHVTLISGRSLGQARGKIAGKFSDEYLHNVAVCELDPEDLKSLGVAPGQNIRLITKSGSVVLRTAVASQRAHRGVVFVPYGPWINSVMSSETYGTGMPSFKGVEAEVTPALNENVLGLKNLIARIREE